MAKIYERRQIAAGLGGLHWQERVVETDGRAKVPDGAVKAPADVEPYDWRPMDPQLDDAGNPLGEAPAAPVPIISDISGVANPSDAVH